MVSFFTYIFYLECFLSPLQILAISNMVYSFRALASSAPIWQFTGLTACSSFYDTASRDFYTSSVSCGDNIHLAWYTIEATGSGEGQPYSFVCFTPLWYQSHNPVLLKNLLYKPNLQLINNIFNTISNPDF